MAFWVGCMLMGVIFVSAIFCTDLIGKNARKWPEEDRTDIETWFGSIGRSMNTLWVFLTLADWSTVSRVVMKESPDMILFFLIYVIFAGMVILSLLTGVLADHINSVTNEAEEEEQKEKAAQRKMAFAAEFKAFKKATCYSDHRSENIITKEDFRKVMKDKEIMGQLEEIGINLEDFNPDDLFICLDRDGHETLCFHEFQQGMEELRIGVTGKQVFKLETALRNAVRRVDPTREHMGSDPQLQVQIRDNLTDANGMASEVQARMELFLDELVQYQSGDSSPTRTCFGC